MGLSKLLRVFRALRFLAALRLMLASIAQSLAMLFWAVVLLCMLWLVLALVFLQAFSVALRSDTLDAETKELIHRDFGSLPQAMFTLFSISTGGTNWEPSYYLVKQAGDVYAMILLLYISFFFISLFNILTGIVVEHVVANAQVDEHDRVMRYKLRKLEQARELKKLFSRIDVDKSGTITQEEFMKAMEDQEILSLMEENEVDPRDAGMFYRILYTASEEQAVDLGHFIDGCMQMRGAALGIDVQILRFQVYHMLKKVMDQRRELHEVRALLEAMPVHEDSALTGGDRDPRLVGQMAELLDSRFRELLQVVQSPHISRRTTLTERPIVGL